MLGFNESEGTDTFRSRSTNPGGAGPTERKSQVDTNTRTSEERKRDEMPQEAYDQLIAEALRLILEEDRR
jgi:hypothetical protein